MDKDKAATPLVEAYDEGKNDPRADEGRNGRARQYRRGGR